MALLTNQDNASQNSKNDSHRPPSNQESNTTNTTTKNSLSKLVYQALQVNLETTTNHLVAEGRCPKCTLVPPCKHIQPGMTTVPTSHQESRPNNVCLKDAGPRHFRERRVSENSNNSSKPRSVPLTNRRNGSGAPDFNST